MGKPYLSELADVRAGNDLYAQWQKYALSLEKSDIQEIVRKGLTHQATALRSMVRELIGGIPAPKLHKKLDLIVLATRRRAEEIR